MCGIAGFVDFTKLTNHALLERMTASLKRRGPDEKGTLIVDACGLAHTRLSIIDVAGSPQPMSLSDRRVSLVYNGELYNFGALREKMRARGAVFKTDGDTEVVLRAVAEDWKVALPTFDGMFAFAAWDRARETLLLARDPLGEKPLYYAMPRPGLIVFGSEPKALLEHPDVDSAIDEDALRQALRFRSVYGSHSLHRGIKQLPPGHVLEFDRTGVRCERYYELIANATTLRPRLAEQTDTELVEAGFKLFMQSVEERLVADVPVGAFLSGGLDSSIIAAAMRKLQPAAHEIRTYSVGFTGDAHNELPHAQVVAEALGTRHTPILVGPDAFIRRMSELSAVRDGPVSQPADVAIAEMSAIAREDVKVALSGEGADEIFGGYPKYSFAGVPHALKATVAFIGPSKTAALAALLGLDGARALIASRALACRTEIDSAIQWFSYFDQKDLYELLPGLGWHATAWDQTSAAHRELPQFASGSSALFRMQAIDCLTWLPGNMLERGDRMTMAEGLEVRPPFLDAELAAFGLALPDRLKIRHRTSKWILRQWANSLLPESIVKRPKWGFHVPLAEWFRGPMREMLFGYLNSPAGLCGTYGNREAIKRLLAHHDEARGDESRPLWTLLSAEVWYQDVYLQRRARAPQSIQCGRNSS